MPKLISELLPVIEHTVVIYLFLMIALRIAGRHQIGQLSVIDLVVLILLGSAVETAMVNGDTSLAAGLVCSATLLLLNRLAAWIVHRIAPLNREINGDPITLVNQGRFVEENLRRVGLTHEDILQALRARGIADVSEAKYAIMEVNGSITVIPRHAKVHRSSRTPKETT
ncbi:predicted membrane protein [Chthonomonas calidirosea]|uniref:Predicted membrane protein n=1 Tax=Chthonomonas calidirosea (strain DSM 23976 / ICMP 18418 / T49) TaxID=1303518 RepID=S0EYQ8_CHTCT|nr:YetF domain-containing protein [Chthonomonas calidirosea]CCW35117.1 Predicted membrane protein [Chthonomonas calidirosea T49]CEK20866.1 predicted membrane protein [Chthonomonas calidirosea]